MTTAAPTDKNGSTRDAVSPPRPPLFPSVSYLSHFALLLYLSAVILVALYAFTSGFFLTRYQLPHRSTCDPLPHPSAIAAIASATHSYTPPPESTRPFDTPFQFASTSAPSTDCWLPSTYSHAIVLLIDALRYNFTAQLPIISSTLLDSPHSTLLFPFIADAPTVTLQRLSALTTGSLPTFIDFAANFQSSELQGDSIVHQMQHSRAAGAASGAGVRSAFMGDDTWMSLFPSSIDETHPYPSFNVKDLHTVDNGCIQHLMPTLQRRRAEVDSGDTQRSVTIAHFLGVDHVGHRYHASHDTMADKLRQLNSVVAEVVRWMDERPDIPTVLFVLGDHGMTEDGNHGGATPLETNSALFIHTSAPFLDSMARAALSSLLPRSAATADTSRAVQQIDFVPTLSLLLGLPIPFGSLGSVLPELFVSQPATAGSASGWSHVPSLSVLVSAQYANAYQVWRYLGIYQQMAGTFDDSRIQQLSELFVRAAAQHAALLSSGAKMDVEGELEVVRLYRHYLDESLAMCRAKWATFNVTLMLLGIVLLVAVTVAIALLLSLAHRVPFSLLLLPVGVGAMLGAVLTPLLPLVLSDVSLTNSLLLLSSFGSSVAVIARLSPSVSRMVAGGVTSSWRLSEWVSALGLLCYMQGLFTNSYIIAEHDVVYFLTMSILLASLVVRTSQQKEGTQWISAVVAVVALRLTCEVGEVLPSSSLSSTFYSPVELVCIIASLFLLPPLLVQLRPSSTSLSRRAISYYLFPLCCLLCLLYWSLQSSSSSDSIHLPLLSPALAAIGLAGLDGYIIRIVVPHLVYASSYGGLVVLLCVGSWRMKEATSSSASSSSTAYSATSFNSSSSALHHRKQNRSSPPSANASTSTSASTTASFNLSSTAASTFALDAFTLLLPTLLLVLGPKSAVLFLLVLLVEWCHPWRRRGDSEWPHGLSRLAFLFFLSLHLFFRTSHSQSFSSLQIAASFIGFDTFYLVPAGLLLALNTFCHLLTLAFLSSVDGGGAAELGLLLVLCVRCVCTLCNAVVNRRHLMVWEIFAPKFVFDALSLVVWCVISVAFAAMRWKMRE